MDNNMDNMTVMDNDAIEIDLYELFRAYIDNIKYILIAFLVGAVLLFGVSYFVIDPTYQSTAKMYVVSSSGSSYIDISDLNLGDQLTADYESLIVGRPVLSQVIDNLKLKMSENDLKGMLTITNPSDTRIIEITATSKDPREAGRIANEVMNVAIDYLPETMDTVSPNVAEEALAIGTKAGPSYVKNTALGAIIGILFALIVITIRFLRDDTIKTEEDVESMFGLTVLTTVPDSDIFKINI